MLELILIHQNYISIMSFNKQPLKGFLEFQIQDLEDEVNQDQRLDNFKLQSTSVGCITLSQMKRSPQRNIESLGNKHIYTQQTTVEKYSIKQTQNTTILMAKTHRIEETESLPIFKRILEKIISSYLKQIASQEKKIFRSVFTFQNSTLYQDLNLQQGFVSFNDLVNRLQLQNHQKKRLKEYAGTFRNLKVFLNQSLNSGYQEINNEFLYILKSVLKIVDSTLLYQHNVTNTTPINDNFFYINQTQNNPPQVKIRKKSITSVKRGQQEIKNLMDQKAFFQSIYFDEKIKYLNLKHTAISCFSQEKIKNMFCRFVKLYSHLLIKLICLDTLETPFQVKNEKQFIKTRSKSQPLDLITNWFSSGSAKSFKSINSLTSINLNNLNDIKLYNSKPDLYSQEEEDSQISQNFVDYGCLSRKRLKD